MWLPYACLFVAVLVPVAMVRDQLRQREDLVDSDPYAGLPRREARPQRNLASAPDALEWRPHLDHRPP